MNKETAQRAAKWWADFLRTRAPLDNGDRSRDGAMTVGIASILQGIENGKGKPDDADKFQSALAHLLETRGFSYLSCDYGPDYILSEAAEVCGVHLGMTRLPWKTNMWIEGEKISVAVGCGAPIKDID